MSCTDCGSAGRRFQPPHVMSQQFVFEIKAGNPHLFSDQLIGTADKIPGGKHAVIGHQFGMAAADAADVVNICFPQHVFYRIGKNAKNAAGVLGLVAGQLGQQFGRPQPDRNRNVRRPADCFPDAGSQRSIVCPVNPVKRGQVGIGLVNRNLFHIRNNFPQTCHHPAGIAAVQFMSGIFVNDGGKFRAGPINIGIPILTPAFFASREPGNDAAVVTGHHTDRLPAQRGFNCLFTADKKTVAVDQGYNMFLHFPSEFCSYFVLLYRKISAVNYNL